MKRGSNIGNYLVYRLNSHQRRQKLSSLHYGWICRQIGIVGTCKRVCLKPYESLVEQLEMMAWRFKSSHIRKIWGRVIHSGRGISTKDRWMDAHRQVGSIPTYSTKMFFETTICYFICEVIVGGWLG